MARAATDVPVDVAGVSWHSDYETAFQEAYAAKKFLLINFVAPSGAQQQLETFLASDQAAQTALPSYVRVRVDAQARADLLHHPAFVEMGAYPGVAIVDLANEGKITFARVVSAVPMCNMKYYRWSPQYVGVALRLPAGTLTQRSMIWAVRLHPERPQSTNGVFQPVLATAAQKHSELQATMQLQGHHNFQQRFNQLRPAIGAGDLSEVCAESWANQGLLDSCLDCVKSWRGSSGHWRGVSSPCRLYGYDIRQGRNGIWYGTGLFAN
jgi:hypothetical protein